jgi:hypothetical protein
MNESSNITNFEENTQINTIANKDKQSIFEYAVVNIICLFLFIAFGYIAIMSMVQTSVIDSSQYVDEVILYQNDNIVMNLLFTALFGVFLFAMKKRYDFFAQVNMKFMEIGLAVYVVVLGLIWVFSVTSVPFADSYSIFETATGAASDDYTPMYNGADFYNKDFYCGYSYFNFYPFQLGFVFLCELVYRIFGTSTAMPIEVINVLCLAVAYLAIAKITKLLFKKRSIEFFSILLLAGCFQPILFCTFAYGNIIGMCCALWAAYFLLKYFRTSKYILLLPCALLLIVSTLAKYNNLIYLVAFAIMLVIHTVKAKKWQSIAFALALCIVTVGTSNLVIMSYESRANTTFSDGVSQTLYLDMGINESYMAPGWYNGIAIKTYLESGLDNELANETAMSDISSRLDYMSSNVAYAIDFFGKKILSQWNENTFESIWISEVKTHYYDTNAIANGMYVGSLGQFFELYFNWYMQILYILFAIGIYCLFINQKSNIETVLLPLVILGGFGYHLLFEGKSQYILTYIPLMIPTAAYAVSCVLNGKYTKIKEIIAKLKHVSEDTPTENI